MTMRQLRIVRQDFVNDFSVTAPPRRRWPRVDVRLALAGMFFCAAAGFALALIVVAA